MAFPDKITYLHTNLVAARNGYLEAAKDAGDSGVAAFFADMASFHEVNADEIKAIAQESGVELTDSASLMSTVHRVVVWVRSAVVRLDASELKPFISGEEQIVKEYDEALDESRETARLGTLLLGQRRELIKKIETMKAVKAAS